MTDHATCDDYLWLTSDAARRWLDEPEVPPSRMVAVASRLRGELGLVRAHLVLEQIELRQRARRKFPRAAHLFFQSTPLEQSTDQRIAEYKAHRFLDAGVIVDLCCGIGGDAMGLCQQGNLLAIDKDPVMVCLAAANLMSCGDSAARVQCAAAEQAPLESADAWHIDPDRRPTGHRTTQLEYHEPNQSAIENLLQRNENAAVKLAPATEVPTDWQNRAELEWIGHSRQCQQLVAFFGRLANHPAMRVATVLDDSGGIRARIVGQESLEVPLDEKVGSFLHEPHPVVLAAKLDGFLAKQNACWRPSSMAGYYTSDAAATVPGFLPFEVIETLPFDVRRIASATRSLRLRITEVKKRGVDVEPAQLLKKLRTKSGRDATLLLIGHPRSVKAVLARRIRPGW